MTDNTNTPDSKNKNLNDLAKQLETLAGDYLKYYDPGLDRLAEELEHKRMLEHLPEQPDPYRPVFTPEETAQRLESMAELRHLLDKS